MSMLATFDTLYLTEKITSVTAARTGDEDPGAADLEVQSLAYFASMLHRWSTDDTWGYDFYTTKDAEPFATEIANALRVLKARGAINDMGMLNALAPLGERLLTDMLKGEAFRNRARVLDVALSTARFMSMPLVIRGIGREPTLRASSMSRPLLDDGAVAVLSEYLDAAKDMMGEKFNLPALAEIILNYFLVAENGVAA